MKLRSHGAGASSSKGKAKLEHGDGSDAEDFGVAQSSDSDYNVLSDEGEDLLDALENSIASEAFNLNYVSDDDSVPKRRKKNSYGKRGSQSGKKAAEEEKDADTETVIGIDPGKIEDTGGIAEKSGRKKKGKKKKDRPVLMWEVLEQENDRWIEENLQIDMDLINQNEIVMEIVEPSDDLIIPLLRYQKEWLAWALKQEESTARGGILADEMGMGKTLQAIALVLFKRSISMEIPDPYLPSSSVNSSRELPPIKGTLVICPLVAVTQWVREIDRFTSKGSTKVLVYHGANRAKNLYQLSDYDFVITTYAIVEAEFRKYVMPPKDKCQYCGKLFYDHKLKIHLKYMCGPGAVRTDKQAKQHRKQQKNQKMPDLEVNTRERNKGNNNGSGHKEMENDDSIESSDVTGLASSKGKSILHCASWERIVLDEAHCIKERRSNTTRAVLALQSTYKWALSGTPLQNRVGELYSLIRFLQIVPFSYYFCKDCDCRTLDYRCEREVQEAQINKLGKGIFVKSYHLGSVVWDVYQVLAELNVLFCSAECPGCEHKNVRHFCWWNRYISTPIQDNGRKGGGRGAMILLKHKILKSLVLRRTKKGRAADLALPPRIVTLRRDSLDVVEEDYYTALYNESQAQFNTYIEAGTLMNNYAHIFDLLTRLRQAVDHPYLVEYSLTSMERKGKTVDTRNDVKCGLCNDTEEDTVVTSCGHTFCKPCLIDFSASMGQNSCPTCSKPLTVDFTSSKDGKEQRSKTTIKGFRPSSILNRIQLDDFQTSTKIDALREEIRFMVERDGSAKAIVFSQFSSFLDLIHYSLQKSGVQCVQLDGSMSMGARDTAIKKFTEEPSCRIFLMSLKAGGVALNLTVASHVFLMDPWWNPAVERQAQDRIHRIGQYKPIRIVRFIIENTVEERILKLQEKKELVFEGTVGGCSEALAKLTEADLRFLFVT